MELNIVIHKCPVTVTPRSGQSKVYGESDPSIRATYRGTVSGETLSGRLSRESGESVGRYRITMARLNRPTRTTRSRWRARRSRSRPNRSPMRP